MLTSHEGGLVMKYRKFSNDFKKVLVEQMLSGTIGASEICRQHEVSRTALYRWQREYESGQLDNHPWNVQLATEVKIKELERIVGQLTLDNEVLKKVVKLAHCQSNSNAKSSGKTKVYSPALPGGAEC
jgi:transposase